ncbi:MAG: M14 family metallopeptidase [Pseudomonadota bacterium]
MLTQYETLPSGLLDLPAARLHEMLPGPALIHLPGRRSPPLFVSVLLHGNEDTGWLAIRTVLKHCLDTGLPRALSLFIGNVEAACKGVRRIEGQPDYNRVWPGSEEAHPAERAMMREVVDAMRVRGVFASLDIHNNTGLNPHYACVNRLEPHFLHLATLFSRIVVYFTRPRGVQSGAFAELCPAVTVECGKPGTPGSVEHAARFIEACLHLSNFPAHRVAAHDIDLYHTVVTVKVPESARFSFGTAEADIDFVPEIDHFNFRELGPGDLLGRIRPDASPRLLAFDEHGEDVGARMFDYSDGRITLKKRLMPAMLTRDARVIRQDCLCYLMERIPYAG